MGIVNLITNKMEAFSLTLIIDCAYDDCDGQATKDKMVLTNLGAIAGPGRVPVHLDSFEAGEFECETCGRITYSSGDMSEWNLTEDQI